MIVYNRYYVHTFTSTSFLHCDICRFFSSLSTNLIPLNCVYNPILKHLFLGTSLKI